MNTVTQQNAASSEESSSAAAELSGQGERLSAMVDTFHLEGVAAERPATSARAFPAWRAGTRLNGHRELALRP